VKLFGGDDLKRVLIIPDAHAPYNDKRAWKLLMQVARAFKWHTCAVLGDFYDCYAVSRYTKDPAKLSDLEEELELARPCLDDLNGVGFKRKFITLGNHEERPETNLKEKAPELYKSFHKADQFGFKSSGWEVYQYRDHARLGKAIVTHDVSANGALAVLNAVQDNAITGHDHQINYVIRGTALGEMHVSATFGWLGDVKHADYMHSLKAKRSWALGFGYGYLEKNGNIHLKPAPIIDYAVVVEGRLFRA
jgi:hypothetical protein